MESLVLSDPHFHLINMIKYKLGNHQHLESGRIMPTIEIEAPFELLSILGGIQGLEEINLLIIFVEGVRNGNIADDSQLGFIIYQPFLWGSVMSCVAEIEEGSIFECVQEFNTSEFLDVCYIWRDFLMARNKL